MNPRLLGTQAASLETAKERTYASAYEALNKGDLKNAERLFGLLAVMAPRDERPWVGLAVARETREEWRAAAGLYEVGGALAPGSVWCQFGQGRAFARLKMNNRAERALDRAEELTDDPGLLQAIEQVRSEL